MTDRLLDLSSGQTNLSHESSKTDSVLFEFLSPILVQTCLAPRARVFFLASCSRHSGYYPAGSLRPVPVPPRWGVLCSWVPRRCQRLRLEHGPHHSSSPSPSSVWHGGRKWQLFHHLSVNSDADHRADTSSPWWTA